MESPLFGPKVENPEDFDQVWTYDESRVKADPDKFKRGNFGGTRIKDPQMYPKTKNVCIIDGGNRRSIGHQLRGAIADKLPVDSYGRKIRPFENEVEVYRDYRFAVVVENFKGLNYFSEKLTDALACGCVPIYWGNRWSTSDFFPGLIHFDDFAELKHVILPQLTPEFYEQHKSQAHIDTIKEHFNTSEDWLVKTYLPEFLK